jgi:hypothetical protein
MFLTPSPGAEEKATRIARSLGVTPTEFIESLIERHPDPPSTTDERPTGMRFRDIVAMLQQDFEATGMTDEELDAFIEAEVKAHRKISENFSTP